jgi:hypothetical protein
MRPNTPHFVVTPESAICHGGHFYATSTIQDTVFGIYHMFVASRNITNTEHTQDAQLLLRRLVIYLHYILIKHRTKTYLVTASPTPHVPDVSTFEGTLDLFMLCVIMELGDLIIPAAYKKKYRRDPDRDHNRRLCTIHARGLARDLRRWWRTHYVFYDPKTGGLVDGDVLFSDIFSQQISVLIAYKRMAEKRNIHGDEPDCTAEVLERLVKKYFPHAATRHRLLDKGFEWSGTRYVVQARPGLISSYTECKYSSYVQLHPLTIKWKAGISSLLGQLLLIRTSYSST